MTKLFAPSALIAATIIASSASAETVLLNYEGQDVEVKDGSQTYDFFNLGPSTNSGPQPIQLTLGDDGPNTVPVGPFSPDGRSDLRISTAERSERVDGFGYVELLYQNNFPTIDVTQVRVFDDSPMNDYIEMMPYGFSPAVSQQARFATVGDIEIIDGEVVSSNLATFGANGENGNIIDDSFDYDTNFAVLNDEEGFSILKRPGDSVILGFKIDVMLEDFGIFGFEQEFALQDACIFDDSDEPMGERYDCGPQETVLASYFGFMEFTRGSVTPGLLGVNTVAGAAAVVPSTVPLPAPFMMLGAGLAGLGLMRRRKHS